MSENNILFDSFNARYLSYKEIAESFIPNDHYYELIKNNHSLLMGPRGSGKTTLLKMLTPAAMYYWDHPRAEKLSDGIPFFSIYIPTDIQWKRQIENFETEFKNNPSYRDLISRLIVTTNVLISTIKTFSFILEFKADKSDKDLQCEAELSKEIIEFWSLTKPISPSFYSIELGLRNRLIEISRHIKQTKYALNVGSEYPNYFYDEYFELINIACSAFENKFKSDISFKNHPFRWALCFDELEIAPKWLQYELLDHLRSRDQKFIFKLTTAPLISLYDKINNKFHQIEARQDDDYKIIRTWTFNQSNIKEWSKFCTRLVTSRLERKYEKKINPNHIFGNSNLERAISESFSDSKSITEEKGYHEGSANWHLIKELAEIDLSFRSYLISRKVDYTNPVPLNVSHADQVHRKIKPLALYRYQYRKATGRRSRKVVPLYYGVPYLYEMCDGNPRALIGIFDEFFSNAERNDYGEIKEFTLNKQSRIITEISNRHLDILSTHPDSNKEIEKKNVNLGDLLRKIGGYFHNRIVNETFSADPPGSFIIDEDINHKIRDLMELALYLGAIIYLEPNEVTSHNGVLGKKFRISYLLSPVFNIPSREYKEIKLSTLLSKVNLNTSKQIKLFGSNEI